MLTRLLFGAPVPAAWPHAAPFRRPASRHRGAWLALLALLFQAWLPVIHHPASLFAADGEAYLDLNRPAGLTLPICHDGGESSAKDTGSGVPAHTQPHCPICLTWHAINAFMPAVDPAILPRPIFHAAYIAHPTPVLAGPRLTPAAYPRAPPGPDQA
jgi:hypothetical protein